MKNSGRGLENRDWRHLRPVEPTTLHTSIRRKLTLTSPTGSRRSVDVVHVRAEQPRSLFCLFLFYG
jgi:hypothetical protein